ncbi:MAG: gliding motility-associated C-terminal domain-containing protein, partial [Bacteroidia bacterium]|nr:gliding motility-associated C-terminal domain-containing protein [Bacteroidia bacterium]
VTINGTPTASATAVQDTICQGASVQLNGMATNGTVLWTTSGNGTFSNPNIASPTYTAGSADAPLVTLTMTVSNPPCPPAIASLQITVIPLPVTSAITGADTVCANSIGNIYSVTNNPGSVYSWSITPIGSGTITGNGSNQITVDWGAAGSATLSVTEQDFFGCPGSTSTLNIIINPSPVAITIAGQDTLCEGATGQYILTPATAGSIYTWFVSGGVPGAQGNDTMDVQWTSPGDYTVIAVELNSFGCGGAPDTFNVHVNPMPPVPVLIGPDTVCENDAVVYYVSSTPGSTYTWVVTGGTWSQNGDTITVTWGPGPNGSITVSETNSFGCAGSPLIINIVINPAPVVLLITGNYPVCEGDTGDSYAVNNNTGSYYLWTVIGGTVTSPVDSTNSVTVDWGLPGVGSVTVREVSANGCTSNPLTIFVNIYAPPAASATPVTDTICRNQPITLNGVATGGNITINWLTSGTGTFSNTNTDTTIYTPSVSDTGTIILSMVVSNIYCPDDTAFVTLIIVPSPIITVTLSSSPADTICFGNSTVITATGGGTYLWPPGNDTTASITVSPVADTWYSVVVSNSYGCVATDSIEIKVIQWGIADAGADMIVCNTDSVLLNGGTSFAGGGIWTTSGDGTFIPNPQTLNATYIPGTGDTTAGTVVLVLTTTGNQCVNPSDTIIIILNSVVTVNAGADQTVFRDQTATIAGTVYGTSGGWWTTTGSGTFTPDSSALNAVYHPGENDYNSGIIYIVLHAANTCNMATDTLILTFPDFIIPNVFTPYPNTPGFNDLFVIPGLPAHSALTIHNRWGMLVFEADNYQNNWDAAEVNEDTYYYILVTPDKKSYHGFVRVIKTE